MKEANAEADFKVLVSGCDIDGIARGKILSKKKFDSSKSGFGVLKLIRVLQCNFCLGYAR
jgi:hypothetical protein